MDIPSFSKRFPRELNSLKGEVTGIFRDTVAALSSADPKQMAIERRISRTTYRHRGLEVEAVQAYREHGIEIEPGMKIGYVVTDARRYCVEPVWAAKTFDPVYYRGLLEKAYGEIAYTFSP
ncbi:MAG: hypothetical protein LUQ31_10945 [Methanoregula sp.]|nr:hypothetical protein [Methanoregula sp.]